MKQNIKKILDKSSFVGRSIYAIHLKFLKTTSYIIHKISLVFSVDDIPNPQLIYWISPNDIVYHTNYGIDDRIEENVFNMKRDRGAVYDGNWDQSNHKFTDLGVYKSFKEHIIDKKEWEDTEFYKDVLAQIRKGRILWNCSTKGDFDKRLAYLDKLISDIQINGYTSSDELDRTHKLFKRSPEITVNIGRNGEFLFQDGRHRLSIAKVIGVEKIPVQILVRHKHWMNVRERAKQLKKNGDISLLKELFSLYNNNPDLEEFNIS